MLTVGAISKDNLVYGIKASRRLPTATLAAAFEIVRTVMWDALLPEIEKGLLGDEEAKVFTKSFIAKTPNLNALPYRSDPVFVRYVLLELRRNNF